MVAAEENDSRKLVDKSVSPIARNKRIKFSDPVETRQENSASFALLKKAQRLLVFDHQNGSSNDMADEKIGTSLDRARAFWKNHGFRTSMVSSPKPGLSIFKTDALDENDGNGSETEMKNVLKAMLGLHPQQQELEDLYQRHLKDFYCLNLYCRRLKEAQLGNRYLSQLLETTTQECLFHLKEEPKRLIMQDPAFSVSERKTQIACAASSGAVILRKEQLDHEWERIVGGLSSTMANAILQSFVQAQDCCIDEIVFKPSPNPKLQRYTIHFGEEGRQSKQRQQTPFCSLPSLSLVATEGLSAVVQAMVESFWHRMLRQGYFASPQLQSHVSPELSRYFASGLMPSAQRIVTGGSSNNLPFSVRAHFTPTYPLSFYIWGKAGTGKSSFLRHFAAALQAAGMLHADGQLHVSCVKQNLNKPMQCLQLEMELRPNNNDLSVMSIVQGRRMALKQTHQGLVVIALEEMAAHDDKGKHDPSQVEVCELLSQRFAGRKGKYHEKACNTRNSDKGLSGDASIIPLFTSNYPLCDEKGVKALSKLEMFSNLTCIEMHAITGAERHGFAKAYLTHCLNEWVPNKKSEIIHLDIPMGDCSDTRPLVRHLRMIAFYASSLVKGEGCTPSLRVSAVEIGFECKIWIGEPNGPSLKLRVGTMGNLFPVDPQAHADEPASVVRKKIMEMHQVLTSPNSNVDEISTVIDYWLGNVFTPTVIVSRNRELAKAIIEVVEESLPKVPSITNVNAAEYKMMKSLYDDHNPSTSKTNASSNLRDDILLAQQKHERGLVLVELSCPTKDAQLLVREMIEDTPSMTAFSTSKSALYKDGILFIVHVEEEISPEIQSRASYIL